MRIGVVFPQTELPTDPETVRSYARRVEELGYRHVEIYDHVLGADLAVHTGWKGPYDVDTTFHETLVFYGFLAAITQLELVTAVVVAPQRQTALLAKQAAEVDVLSGGRFRLGIAIGWNPVEYEGLGQSFSTRGEREEEHWLGGMSPAAYRRMGRLADDWFPRVARAEARRSACWPTGSLAASSASASRSTRGGWRLSRVRAP